MASKTIIVKCKLYGQTFVRKAVMQSVTYCETNPYVNKKSLFLVPKSHVKLRNNEFEQLAPNHTK